MEEAHCSRSCPSGSWAVLSWRGHSPGPRPDIRLAGCVVVRTAISPAGVCAPRASFAPLPYDALCDRAHFRATQRHQRVRRSRPFAGCAPHSCCHRTSMLHTSCSRTCTCCLRSVPPSALSAGTCEWGDRCRYLHDERLPAGGAVPLGSRLASTAGMGVEGSGMMGLPPPSQMVQVRRCSNCVASEAMP